ncbi:MAG TPA: AbrB/MazE/SpoVT family DNA-binding domain-containing protein [Patescibacteria group bacterium]|nr:AbrB/MazE/SpoVT family DNA-binding domain-containing protein [Patescibacteria group bacterium]
MVGTSTVTSKGQVTVPESVRLFLGIVPGDSLYFEVEPENEVAKIRKAPKSMVSELAGSLKSKVPFVDNMSEVRDKVWREVGRMYEKKLYGKKKG